MTEIDAWYTLRNLFEVTDILEGKEYDLRNWRDVREIVSKLDRITGNAFRLQKENEQLKIDLGIAEDNHKLDKEIIDDIHNEFQKVKKENEQLKQRIKELEIENTAQSDAIDGLQETLTHFDLEEVIK